MFPTLLEIGPLTIRAYGALLALSFLIGVPLAARRARGAGLDPDVIYSMAWLIVLSGVVGARVMFVIQHAADFRADPLEVIRVWKGGLTLYGGLILASLATIVYLMRRARAHSWGYVDALAPFVSLGQGLTRIGCFLNGCCFGKSCTLPWGVTYPPDSLPAQTLGMEHHLHPSQLYQSGLALATALGLLWLWRYRRFEGQVFWLWVGLVGGGRFFSDFFRWYEPAQLTDVGGVLLSQSQLISLVILVAAAIGYGIRAQHARVSDGAASAA